LHYVTQKDTQRSNQPRRAERKQQLWKNQCRQPKNRGVKIVTHYDDGDQKGEGAEQLIAERRQRLCNRQSLQRKDDPLYQI
jgi:hypothetical protein